jgi:hypothetical protein
LLQDLVEQVFRSVVPVHEKNVVRGLVYQPLDHSRFTPRLPGQFGFV